MLERNIELNNVLHVAIEALRISAIILIPIIPDLANHLLDKINVQKPLRTWNNLTLFWKDKNLNGVELKLSDKKVILFKRILQENVSKVQA